MASLVKGGSQQYGEISRSDKGGLSRQELSPQIT